MPDDCLVFNHDIKFETADDSESRLADEIFSLQTMNKASVEDTLVRSVKMESYSEPKWDGNVPPDFNEEFDFLL